MAMHKKLQPGSVLFTYQMPFYRERLHRSGGLKYLIKFKALVVYNRRERSSGAMVPIKLKPTLEKLGIKYTPHTESTLVAIGCRDLDYFSCESNTPYPTPEQVIKAHQAYQDLVENQVRWRGLELQKIEFIEQFKEKKMSNADSLFSLSNSLSDYIEKETFIN